jgi:periplasmic protein TonB
MASVSLADQLDDAIDAMMTDAESAMPQVDLKIGDLLSLAAELRLAPDPAFRAALRAQLLKQNRVSRGQMPKELRASRQEPAHRDASLAPDLPALFGIGCDNYPVHHRNFAISGVIHAAAIAVIATAGFWLTKQPRLVPHATSVVMTEVEVYPLPEDLDKIRGGGGGGDQDRLSELNGSLPRFAREQIAPPSIIVRNEQPKLAAEPTLVGPPAISVSPTAPAGNPLAAILQPPSNGTGTGSGIGTGAGGGIGSGYGAGFGPGYGGGMGGGAFRVGGGVSAPRAIYDPEPEYSEEARKAKYQGRVLLWVIVGQDGRPRDIHVQRSLGMGLDEKAIEAVRQWRFEPSTKDGKPVPVQVNIEVSFRLY